MRPAAPSAPPPAPPRVVRRRGGHPAREPVILVPGFLAGDSTLAPMARMLREQGYRTYRSPSTPTSGAPSTPPPSSRRGWRGSPSAAAPACRSSATAWAGCSRGAWPSGAPTWSPASSRWAARCWPRAPTTCPWPASVEMLVRLSRAGWPGLMSEDCVAGECARQSFDESRQPLPAGRRLHRDLLQARRHRRLAGLHRPARRTRRGDRLPRRPGVRPARDQTRC